MNRPDKAGEPSMEEILASIRQTLAQEKDGGRAATDRSASGPFARANGVSRPAAERAPAQSLGRLTDALRQHAPAPSNGLGSKRPSSFDDDLADILDGPPGLNGVNVGAPKPSLRITPDVPGFLVPRTSEAKDVPPAPQPLATPAPIPVAAPAEAQAAPEPAMPKASFPMRRGGFYPPAGYSPTLPSLPPLPEPPPGIEPAARAEEQPNASRHSDGVLKRLAEIGATGVSLPAAPAQSAPAAVLDTEQATVAAEPAPLAAASSEQIAVSEPEPQLGPPPGIQAEPVRAAEPEPKLAPVVDEAPRPVPLVAGLAESIAAVTPVPEILAPVAAEKPVEVPEPELIIEAVIAEVVAEPVEEPEQAPLEMIVAPAPVEAAFSPAPAAVFAPEPVPVEKPMPAPQYNGVHYNGAVAPAPAQPMAEPPASAARLALDALAQGLAAAASHPIPRQQRPAQPSYAPAPQQLRHDPYASQPAEPLVPVAEPDPRHYPAAAAPRMTAMSPFDPNLAVRTLEDTVADMLKPLLQQWLADNMPRIIEKALRVEAASAVKKGHGPQGA